MAFDPTKPADNAPIVGQVFRDQFNALKSLIDAQQAQIAALQSQVTIVKLDGSHFSIIWRGSLPLEWAVQSQGNQGGIWDINTVVAGNVMLVGVSGSPYAVRMVGRDAGHNPVTDVSNVLILNPPVPPSNIVLSYDGSTDEASWTYDGDAPSQWELSYSQDGGATWSTVSLLDGSANNDAPEVEPSLMRIRALDENNSPISDFSNSVSVG
jgi:hypothetical protein